MIHAYNKVMGRVDQLDQNVMGYMTQYTQQEMVVVDTPILLWISATQSAGLFFGHYSRPSRVLTWNCSYIFVIGSSNTCSYLGHF